VNEDTDEVLRRQPVLRAFVLAFAGTGPCPGCHQQKAIFAPRRVAPEPTRERCLDGWRTAP
jgi:hypothetical protein